MNAADDALKLLAERDRLLEHIAKGELLHNPPMVVDSSGLLAENIALRTERDALLERLAALAPPEPLNQDEFGGCIYCRKDVGQEQIYATADPKDHKQDCPWLRARQLLEGK